MSVDYLAKLANGSREKLCGCIRKLSQQAPGRTTTIVRTNFYCRWLIEEKIPYKTGMLSAMGVLTSLRCCPPPAGRLQKVVLIWILQSITRMQSKCLWNIYTSAYMPPVN
jgi:hypothetical protein